MNSLKSKDSIPDSLFDEKGCPGMEPFECHGKLHPMTLKFLKRIVSASLEKLNLYKNKILLTRKQTCDRVRK